MPFASNVLTGGALARLTGSLRVEFLMRGSRNRPFTGAKRLSQGFVAVGHECGRTTEEAFDGRPWLAEICPTEPILSFAG
jgi:hypothetical protein